MTTIEPEKRQRSAVVLRGSPGHSPPAGPAIQPGKKFVCVVGERMLGRFAAITTMNAQPTAIATSEASASHCAALKRASTAAGERRARLPVRSSSAVSRRGSVLASLDMREGPPRRALKD